MKVALLATLTIGGSDSDPQLEDLLEFLKLEAASIAYSSLWVMVYCINLSPDHRQQILQALDMTLDRLLVVDKRVEKDEGVRLIAGVLAFLHQIEAVWLYDVDRDESSGPLNPGRDGVASLDCKLFGLLRRLDSDHAAYKIAEIQDSLEGLIIIGTEFRSPPARILKRLVVPLVRFMGTLNDLLISLVPGENETSARSYSSLAMVDLEDPVEGLVRCRSELDSSLASSDIVVDATEFFEFGCRVLVAVRKGRRVKLEEEVQSAFGWWYAYHLAASREMWNTSHHGTALLHLVRAFENYGLAYFANLGELEFEGKGSKIRFRGGKKPEELGLRYLNDRMFGEGMRPGDRESLRAIGRLRLTRNMNYLIHGYRVPDGRTIAQARKSVKGAIKLAESAFESGGNVLRGILGRYSSGERLEGNLGTLIAEALVQELPPSVDAA